MLPVNDRDSGRELRSLVPIRFKLAGVTYDYGIHNTQHNIETVTLGDFGPADLMQEPDNKYDPHAIRVVWKGQFHLGYIPQKFSRPLSQILAQGRRIQALNLRRHIHPDYKTLGVSVQLQEI